MFPRFSFFSNRHVQRPYLSIIAQSSYNSTSRLGLTLNLDDIEQQDTNGYHPTPSSKMLESDSSKTFALVKPDALTPFKYQQIDALIKLNEFEITRRKLIWLSPKLADSLFPGKSHDSDHEEWIDYITSAPCLALELAKDDAVLYWQITMGPEFTDDNGRDSDSIRGILAIDSLRNAVDGSEEPEDATNQLKLVFSDSIPELNYTDFLMQRAEDAHSTLAMIKPDISQDKEMVGKIINRIVARGYKIKDRIDIKLSKTQASRFYAEHEGKPFFDALVGFMSSGPVIALLLDGDDVIRGWRMMIGPTNLEAARHEFPQSIRALFGTDGRRNAAHGSDSPESAQREINFFFFPRIKPEEDPLLESVALPDPEPNHGVASQDTVVPDSEPAPESDQRVPGDAEANVHAAASTSASESKKKKKKPRRRNKRKQPVTTPIANTKPGDNSAELEKDAEASDNAVGIDEGSSIDNNNSSNNDKDNTNDDLEPRTRTSTEPSPKNTTSAAVPMDATKVMGLGNEANDANPDETPSGNESAITNKDTSNENNGDADKLAADAVSDTPKKTDSVTNDDSTSAIPELAKPSDPMYERTFGLIKPDAYPQFRRQIIKHIIEKGLTIIVQEEVTLTAAAAEIIYSEMRTFPVFSRMVEFVTSGPVLSLVLEGPDAIAVWRTMAGPTNPKTARFEAHDSIRAKYGTDVQSNAVHASKNTKEVIRAIDTVFYNVLDGEFNILQEIDDPLSIDLPAECEIAEERTDEIETNTIAVVEDTDDTRISSEDVKLAEDNTADTSKPVTYSESIAKSEPTIKDASSEDKPVVEYEPIVEDKHIVESESSEDKPVVENESIVENTPADDKPVVKDESIVESESSEDKPIAIEKHPVVEDTSIVETDPETKDESDDSSSIKSTKHNSPEFNNNTFTVETTTTDAASENAALSNGIISSSDKECSSCAANLLDVEESEPVTNVMGDTTNGSLHQEPSIPIDDPNAHNVDKGAIDMDDEMHQNNESDINISAQDQDQKIDNVAQDTLSSDSQKSITVASDKTSYLGSRLASSPFLKADRLGAQEQHSPSKKPGRIKSPFLEKTELSGSCNTISSSPFIVRDQIGDEKANNTLSENEPVSALVVESDTRCSESNDAFTEETVVSNRNELNTTAEPEGVELEGTDESPVDDNNRKADSSETAPKVELESDKVSEDRTEEDTTAPAQSINQSDSDNPMEDEASSSMLSDKSTSAPTSPKITAAYRSSAAITPHTPLTQPAIRSAAKHADGSATTPEVGTSTRPARSTPSTGVHRSSVLNTTSASRSRPNNLSTKTSAAARATESKAAASTTASRTSVRRSTRTSPVSTRSAAVSTTMRRSPAVSSSTATPIRVRSSSTTGPGSAASRTTTASTRATRTARPLHTTISNDSPSTPSARRATMNSSLSASHARQTPNARTKPSTATTTPCTTRTMRAGTSTRPLTTRTQPRTSTTANAVATISSASSSRRSTLSAARSTTAARSETTINGSNGTHTAPVRRVAVTGPHNSTTPTKSPGSAQPSRLSSSRAIGSPSTPRSGATATTSKTPTVNRPVTRSMSSRRSTLAAPTAASAARSSKTETTSNTTTPTKMRTTRAMSSRLTRPTASSMRHTVSNADTNTAARDHSNGSTK